MLLCNADIECALWAEVLLENADARSARHGRGDSDDLLVILRVFHKLIGEDFRERRRANVLFGVPLWDVKLRLHGVELVGRLLRGLVTMSFLGLDVQKDRLVDEAFLVFPLDVFQHFDQRLHVVPIDRADVVEAELLEQLAPAA